MWGKWQPSWGGNKVKPVEVRTLHLGDTIWFKNSEGKEVTRTVTMFTYNQQKELITLEYEGFPAVDRWGSSAIVMKQVPKK